MVYYRFEGYKKWHNGCGRPGEATTTKIWLKQQRRCLQKQPLIIGRTKAAAAVLAGATSEFRSNQGSGNGAC